MRKRAIAIAALVLIASPAARAKEKTKQHHQAPKSSTTGASPSDRNLPPGSQSMSPTSPNAGTQGGGAGSGSGSGAGSSGGAAGSK